jgi:hypothetical protein
MSYETLHSVQGDTSRTFARASEDRNKMIVADIVGSLGNQLFSYASTKAISLDLGYEYRYHVIKPYCATTARPTLNPEGSYIDNVGQEYCYYFEKVFHIDAKERIADVPASVSSEFTWNRLPSTNFNKDVYSVSDNTHLCGYFLCPKYFEHRRAEVLKWFRFQKVYIERCQEKLNKIAKLNGATHLVSLNIRCGRSYQRYRLIIDSDYYKNAIQRIRDKFYGEKTCFVLFSDDMDVARRMLKTEKDIVLHSGTMFADLCSMSLCDSHIISNGTFSWWGAWLADETKGVVVRPSIWPTADKNQPFAPLDIYPSDWIAVDAKRAKLTVRMIASAYNYNDPEALWFTPIIRVCKRVAKRTIKVLLPSFIIDILKVLRKKCSDLTR